MSKSIEPKFYHFAIIAKCKQDYKALTYSSIAVNNINGFS